MTPEQRFWAKVEKTDTCWLWTAYSRVDGYGQFFDGQRVVLAHRFAYELANGPIPGGLVIDHLCRVKKCIRAAHLEAVPQRENVLRGLGPDAQRRRTAAQTECKHGHEFTPDNTVWVTKNGYRSRMCRTCKIATARRLRARAKQRQETC